MVYRILTHTQSLIQCQRVQVGHPFIFQSDWAVTFVAPTGPFTPPSLKRQQFFSRVWSRGERHGVRGHRLKDQVSYSLPLLLCAADALNISFLPVSPFESRFPINVGVTGYVATRGEVKFQLKNNNINFSYRSYVCYILDFEYCRRLQSRALWQFRRWRDQFQT